MADAQGMEPYKEKSGSAVGELDIVLHIADDCIGTLSRHYTPRYTNSPGFRPSFDGCLGEDFSRQAKNLLRFSQSSTLPSAEAKWTIDFYSRGGRLEVEVWRVVKGQVSYSVDVLDRQYLINYCVMPSGSWDTQAPLRYGTPRRMPQNPYYRDQEHQSFIFARGPDGSGNIRDVFIGERHTYSGYRIEGSGFPAKVFSADIQGKTAEEIDKVKENLCKALGRYFCLMDEEEVAARAQRGKIRQEAQATLERKLLESVCSGIEEAESLFGQEEYALVSKKLGEFLRRTGDEPRRAIVISPDGELERRIGDLEERLDGIFDGRIEALREDVKRGEISRSDAERRYRGEIESLMPYGSVLYDRFHYVKLRCASLREGISRLSWEDRKEKKKAGDRKWSGAENAEDEMGGDAEAAVRGAHGEGAFAGKIREYLFMDVRELRGRLFSGGDDSNDRHN